MAHASTPEEQLKELQDQVALLQQQIQLTNLQQTQESAAQTTILTALKAQVDAQSGLDKAKAQADFAKLAGIKAGLDSVGAPVGKEGSITVSAGTSGALMLSLRQPMLKGLEDAAEKIATALKKAGTSAVYVGTDAQVQSALQASLTDASLAQAITALDGSTSAVRAKLGDKRVSAAFFAAAAAAGLALNTVVGLEKFFRVDTTYSVFDAGDEAQQTLILMLQWKLEGEGVHFRNLSTVSILDILAQATNAQNLLLSLKNSYDVGAAVSVAADKLKSDDPHRPSQDLIDRLKADLAIAKTTLDALHPTLKPDGFWSYVQGLTTRVLMQDSNHAYLPRLVVSAKAQTIQVVEKRTWRSDKIFGKSDIQIEYRLLDTSGNLLDSGLTLATFIGNQTTKAEPLYNFPSPKP